MGISVHNYLKSGTSKENPESFIISLNSTDLTRESSLLSAT